MKKCVLFAAVFAAAAFAADTAASPHAMQLADILAWKRIQAPMVSNDGQWFAYKLAPNEGDAEVVIRNLKSGAERRFPIGEQPLPPSPYGPPAPPPPPGVAIAGNSQFAAFLVYPNRKETLALASQHKRVETNLVLVNLTTGAKKQFDKIRRFAFSGDRSTEIAMLRYAPEPPKDAKKEDQPQGADMIVDELASGAEMNVGNVSDFAFDKKGNWLAWLIDAQDKAGNGIQVRNLATGAVLPLDSAAANYKGLAWTEKGDGLATLRGVADKKYEDKLYTVVAFRNFSAPAPEKIIFDPASDKSFPEGMAVSPNRNPSWMADLSGVNFGIHELRAKEDEPKNAPPEPDMVIWNWKDKRLEPMQEVQENQDKNFSFLCEYRPSEHKFLRLSDDALRQVAISADYKFAVGNDVRAYQRESNLDGKHFEDVYAINLKTGDRKLALQKARWVFAPSPDASRLLYYDDGAFYTFDLETGESHNITKQINAIFWDNEDDHNVVKPPRRPIGWSSDSKFVLLSDGWDIWKAPADGGAGVNLTGNGVREKIRYQTRFKLDPDEKGIDLSQPIYVSAYGEWTKKGGIGVIEPNRAGIRMLHWDDAHYQTLLKAKHAGVYLYTRETTQDFPNFYAGDAKLEGDRVTDANPQQKDVLWSSGVKIVNYTSDKGDKLQGSLYLPANYDPSKTYPTIVYIYEKLSQATNHYAFPTFNGFNIAHYTSDGYAVLTPDIVYKVNDPGMSAVWCIVPAVKAAVATGVVDAKRVALHGHSWGGYQTAFTVTQTNIFHAAIAGAPLTDMIAMYNAVYWNTGSANQPIFESSQGRFTTGPWDNLEAYQRNSPVYHAKNVSTPLLMLANNKDGAVDWTQGIEYFNTLRRLGKPVVLLEYKGENHGLRKPENMKDYTMRMQEFFDYELKDRQPPKWWSDGVPVLKQKEEIEQRVKEMNKATGGQ